METRKDHWIQIFLDWEKSGLIRAEYCRKNDIAISTFDYWRQRIRKESEGVEETALVKLPVQFSSAVSTITIELPSAYKIHLAGNYDSHTLKHLIRDINEVAR